MNERHLDKSKITNMSLATEHESSETQQKIITRVLRTEMVLKRSFYRCAFIASILFSQAFSQTIQSDDLKLLQKTNYRQNNDSMWGRGIKRKLDEDELYPNADDFFAVRHERKKRDNTAKQRTSSCVKNNDGSFGQVSSIPVQISYTYEVIIEKKVFETSIHRAILAIEDAINQSLLEFIFPSCQWRARKRRLGVSYARSRKTQEERSLLVKGMVTSPTDMFNTETSCRSFRRTELHDCGLVMGGLILYLEENSDDSELDALDLNVISFLRDSFDKGLYISAFEGVKELNFVSEELPGFSFSDDQVPEIGLPEQQEVPMSFILAGCIIAIIIGAGLVFGDLSSDDEKGLPSEKYRIITASDLASDMSSDLDLKSEITDDTRKNQRIRKSSRECFDPSSNSHMGLVEFQQMLFAEET